MEFVTRLHHALQFTVPCLLLGTALAVNAQVILFEQPDLQGRKMTIRAEEPNLADSDFNDRAQSLLVQGAPWEVCVGSGFHGDCMVLQPGPYRELDRRFTRSISSLRPVGVAAYPQGAPPQAYSPPPGQGYAPQQQYAAPPLYVQPPPPSSCYIGKTEVCPACAVTCNNGQRSFCRPGYEYLAFGKTLTCQFQPTCECRPGG